MRYIVEISLLGPSGGTVLRNLKYFCEEMCRGKYLEDALCEHVPQDEGMGAVCAFNTHEDAGKFVAWALLNKQKVFACYV